MANCQSSAQGRAVAWGGGLARHGLGVGRACRGPGRGRVMEVEVMKRSQEANIDYTGIRAMHRALKNRRLHTAAIVCSVPGQTTRPSLTSTRKSFNYI